MADFGPKTNGLNLRLHLVLLNVFICVLGVGKIIAQTRLKFAFFLYIIFRFLQIHKKKMHYVIPFQF